MYNVLVQTYDWNVIKSQSIIPLYFIYYHDNVQPNHSYQNDFIKNNSYIINFTKENINYDLVLSEALSQPLLTFVLTQQIFYCQNKVEYFVFTSND